MEFSGEFKYRKYWLRGIVGATVLYIIFPIKDLLLSNVLNIIRDDIYLSGSFFIGIIEIFIYYKMTKKYFLRNGRYKLNADTIEIHMRNKVKIVKLDKVKRVVCMEKNIFGERGILLSIEQNGKKTIKIVSDIISNDYDISSSSLYEIYKFVEYNAGHLENAHYNNSECFVLQKKKTLC